MNLRSAMRGDAKRRCSMSRAAIRQSIVRDRLSFRAVNRSSAPDHDPGLQRHQLLPRQLLGQRCFGALFSAICRERLGFDDFRSNGLLLPARDDAALRLGLPLHRGPHRDYNAMVIERVGQVEGGLVGATHQGPGTGARSSADAAGIASEGAASPAARSHAQSPVT
jgi:hypothetical protein